MAHMETGNIEQVEANAKDVEEGTSASQAAYSESRSQDIPCCCPGCFSFDF